MRDVREPVPDMDIAIQRALEAAGLRAGDSLGSTVATAAPAENVTSVEAGDVALLDDGA